MRNPLTAKCLQILDEVGGRSKEPLSAYWCITRWVFSHHCHVSGRPASPSGLSNKTLHQFTQNKSRNAVSPHNAGHSRRFESMYSYSCDIIESLGEMECHSGVSGEELEWLYMIITEMDHIPALWREYRGGDQMSIQVFAILPSCLLSSDFCSRCQSLQIGPGMTKVKAEKDNDQYPTFFAVKLNIVN